MTMRWYGAVDLALACKRCCPRLYGWLERAQTRLGSYGPDGAARSASAGSADNMLFTLGAEGPALGGSSGRRAQRHRSRVLRGAPTTPSSSSAAAALGLMPGPPGQPFGGSDFVASGGGAVAPQGGGGCSGGFTTGSAGAAEASPAGRKAGSAKSRASSKLERRRAAAREQAAKEHPPLSVLRNGLRRATLTYAAATILAAPFSFWYGDTPVDFMPYAVASDAAAIVYDGGGHFVTLLSQEATESLSIEPHLVVDLHSHRPDKYVRGTVAVCFFVARGRFMLELRDPAADDKGSPLVALVSNARGGWAAYTFKKERTGLKVNTGLKP
ncbi:hypothetical protein EMIHUDRAFT_244650 [Emiliania huxleyi CCMP1516]|uniref:Uncharacterized protein n=2 Tax=Emiliania huxleyi TaxID=2903 RepID=A0A0D3J0A8_EMIH1|nr:hypothetical protein EMIHUDRAFT_244650 [Emiliania huxleyi CCMP1516]EOD16943.1 hypothetical protein EMIHUDRAFT_244650 [Emiliania huxleyi CCMP1516]|eukprot:XP_005769372.1 hypothetical protein EMIHUDRAFT_244650 [Emiliania huxleyi CCMP1516]